MQEAERATLLCAERLIRSQLPHGGWPSTRSSAQAAVEPTALALLALPPDSVSERGAAIHFLLRIQNPNGSWPAFVGDDEKGSGLTGLALYTLRRCGVEGPATDRAIRWLLNSQGQESHWLWKWKFRIFDRHVRFDPGKFGWPWGPETVSWVVPTSYSLLALKNGSGASRQALLRFRIRRGVEMLYDRICPLGGWNAGNGVVYRSPMAPHPDATAVALLALRGEPGDDLVTPSLEWLERRAETCFAPWSLAWTILALDAFGRPTEYLIKRLAVVAEAADIGDCATLAVAAMALACTDGPNAFGAHS
jgi:Prenyltransferase and squalene oxidase repeat